MKLATLHYWASTGLVEPSVRGSQGPRVTRRWTVRDTVIVCLIKSLRDAGCSLQKVRKAKEVLERRWAEAVGDIVLLWDGKDLLAVGRFGDLFSAVEMPGQHVLHVAALPIGHWRAEAERAATVIKLEEERVHDRVKQRRKTS